MIKFISYLVLFIIIGYFYGGITEGTVFDNFFVMLLGLFVLIFVVEYITSLFKKKGNSEEVDLDVMNSEKKDPETWNEMIETAKMDFDKTWNLTYKDHEIQIVNRYNHEQLFINGELVSEKKRKGWVTWVTPSQTLTGAITVNNHSQVVKVKLGGLISLNCKVYVGEELIFKKKVSYNLLTGGVKEND
ncbi:hypothetical protein JOC85_001056 [Bacillus mesophilus]|uniref:Uncharacterized protein n=1 Tax=Bacillus mesophilus TaxID=1808955 RepID=A0A6M0Q443_9BACI|nr:hypothetical protein [Bacillus mesophilus]MBM7660289.1 hypothetical protein [Bacillus mesophilus]NEY71002.1 hypothetical protein [Bacillus mesophilus]